ncbi:radical SAM family heme chaperone HemW [Tepidimicrobium xylanilyticum]|uniref:Heme chaperone HemW n=1 Tax=Tepidimicrobium xylanilyticum TaxID=1123352 RepID=A0A1H2T4T7_9FIRM|nr:radical SAM family heme chaperone HemW [Tepidimicrobium xylanilyticum]GMG96027.1 coproporphyrinogen III oxidase [Tepidimicrobium xylanilyticum]SDW38878.1 oxygen-independent coproporphyrinogen-3 oxidase [Tepidimicrobium xylanilyticum]
MKDLGLYVHIPFCSSKCFYCDFISFSNIDVEVPEYISYLIKEIELYESILEGYRIKTIFIGGGTPSYIDEEYIGRILNNIFKVYNTDRVEEITIEANPGTLNEEKLKAYMEYGINRISMGVQSLEDNLLRAIGRIHSSKDFYDSLDLLRKFGFNNVNVDLMFGLPGQCIEDCQNTLKEVIRLGVEHISYYSLIFEENTLMTKWYGEGIIELPNEDEEREMYHKGIEILKNNGYKHYEISNFAKMGYECKHNLFYWKLKPYIGLGLAAHSNINNKRYWNHNNFKDYYDKLNENRLPIEGEEIIDKNMEIAEYLIMGLRLVEGINKREFKNRFNVDVENIYGNVLKKYEAQGLLYMDDEWIRFTSRGLDLSNVVYVDLLV